MSHMKVLVTGGAGYIGSTTASALLDAGHTPVLLDSLETGCAAFAEDRIFYRGDIADRALLERVLTEHPDIALTLHFAARIVVPESVQRPGLYYRNNVLGSLALFENLLSLGQTRVVFSSSASVYRSPADQGERDLRVHEDSPLAPASPYARSKAMTESMLADLCAATELQAVSLRYFNPIGADPGLRSGPFVPDPSHVLGRMLRASAAQPFFITGTDYPTRDGSGLRDYVHVWDLALAHVAAAERFGDAMAAPETEGGHLVLNVGTGQGVTVRELVSAFEAEQPGFPGAQEAPPRPGDTAGAYADISRIRRVLGWEPQHSTRDAIASALAWQAHWAHRTGAHQTGAGGAP